MKDKILDVLGAVAPAIATALGGPLAGVATQTIAAKLLGNSDASTADIEAAILNATPADLVRLKEIEAEFAAEMEQVGVDLEKIAAGDRSSARDRQVAMRDWTPSVLGVLIIIGFFGILAYLFRVGLPNEGQEILLIMMGALGAMTTQVGNYFFGSSVGSKSKEAIIAGLKGNAK